MRRILRSSLARRIRVGRTVPPKTLGPPTHAERNSAMGERRTPVSAIGRESNRTTAVVPSLAASRSVRLAKKALY